MVVYTAVQDFSNALDSNDSQMFFFLPEFTMI